MINPVKSFLTHGPLILKEIYTNKFQKTVAQQENNFDSDVVPESNQIHDLLMPRNNSQCTIPNA